MSGALYTREILRLATAIPYQQRLENPDGSAELRSRTCGSTVIAEVMISNRNTLVDLGITINACALGQASAAILGAQAIGRTAAEIVQARSGLEQFFAKEAGIPGEWKDMDKLAVARDHKGRHAAILLPYDALIAALLDAAEKKAA